MIKISRKSKMGNTTGHTVTFADASYFSWLGAECALINEAGKVVFVSRSFPGLSISEIETDNTKYWFDDTGNLINQSVLIPEEGM